MPTHSFKIGSAVTLAGGRTAAEVSRYVVEAQMPPVGTLLQYRIKSDLESFRRVVVEHELTAFSLTPVTPSLLDQKPALRVHPGEEN